MTEQSASIFIKEYEVSTFLHCGIYKSVRKIDNEIVFRAKLVAFSDIDQGDR